VLLKLGIGKRDDCTVVQVQWEQVDGSACNGVVRAWAWALGRLRVGKGVA
jgi:hypothetical protein